MMTLPIDCILFVQDRSVTHFMPTIEYHTQMDVFFHPFLLGGMFALTVVLKSLNHLLFMCLFPQSRSVKPC
jgi:hypothetical protein